MLAPGGVPPWLASRLPQQPWQQYLTELGLIFMARHMVDPKQAAVAKAILALHQRFGPQLGVLSISFGTYTYQNWHKQADEHDRPSGWANAVWHFVRLDFPPDGSAAPHTSGVQQPPELMLATQSPPQIELTPLRN